MSSSPQAVCTGVVDVGDSVLLTGYDEPPGTIIPDGWHRVSKVNDDGSFHVGGLAEVQPSRVVEVRKADETALRQARAI